jgi:chorismate mutase
LEIEAIDREIILLIVQRNKMAEKIFEAKKKEGLQISDPEREKQVLNRAMNLAAELDLNAGAIGEIFGILIKMSLQRQHELQKRDQE